MPFRVFFITPSMCVEIHETPRPRDYLGNFDFQDIRFSDFRQGSKQKGARIRTQNHPPQQQWAHSAHPRRFESKDALLKPHNKWSTVLPGS